RWASFRRPPASSRRACRRKHKTASVGGFGRRTPACQRTGSWLPRNDCSDPALVLGDDGEAPAQIGQPAIIKGADLVRSNVEGGAPFNGEAFETRPLGGDHSTLPFLIDGSLRTG